MYSYRKTLGLIRQTLQKSIELKNGGFGGGRKPSSSCPWSSLTGRLTYSSNAQTIRNELKPKRRKLLTFFKWFAISLGTCTGCGAAYYASLDSANRRKVRVFASGIRRFLR